MKRYLVIIAALSLLAYFSCGRCLAQEEAAEKEMEFSWGKVNSVSSDQIVVTEYDYSNEEEITTTYTIAPDVKLQNVSSLKDIVAGNNIWVGYVMSEDKKVAVIIEVQEPSYQDEYVPEETAVEESEEYPDETSESETPEYHVEESEESPDEILEPEAPIYEQEELE